MRRSHKFLKNLSFGFISRIWRIILAIITIPYVVNKLGADAYGVLAVIMTLVGYFSLIEFGMLNTVVKYLSEFLARNDQEMVKKTRKLGFKTYHSDFLSENLNSKYDLIHASHIIEHFTYLEACDFLDKCLLVLNKKGYLIIRSPLMNYHFYDDMSHIKPYPPHAVMNYFLLDQQSKQSQNKVKQISVNYRRESLVSKSSGKIGVVIGILFKVLYLSLNIKSLRPNGYILILQKIKWNS